MSDITLLHSTGHQKIDQILQGVIGLYELSFPDRIRGYYLVGSYTDLLYTFYSLLITFYASRLGLLFVST